MESIFNIDDEYIEYYLAEEDLIKSISIDKKRNKINYNLFSNLIAYPIGMDSFWEYKGFYLGFNIRRELLDFNPDEKPGDYDIVIIPYCNNKIYFDRTVVLEAKIVRPTRENPKKAPNSYGISQMRGLINDGFPLVGLIHFCMTEPLMDEEKSVVKMDLTPFDVDNPHNNENFMKNTIDKKVDHFSWFSAVNQMKRLVSKDIPKYVGLCTVGVNITKHNEYAISFDHEFNNHYESGYFNPYAKQTTIEKIESFWNNNKELFTDVNI